MNRTLSEILGFGAHSENRNLLLLLGLLFVIGGVPFFPNQLWVSDLAFGAVLLLSIRSVSLTRRTSQIAWSIGIIPLIGVVFFDFLPSWLGEAARLLLLPFFVYTVFVLMRSLFRATSVTAADLLGAASTYLLIGLMWAVIFMWIRNLEPASFSFPDGDIGDSFSLVYFSYVTLVTLGYGEITPVTEVARSFAVIEAMMGSLFLAILVARLVSLYSAPAQQPEEKPEGESVDT